MRRRVVSGKEDGGGGEIGLACRVEAPRRAGKRGERRLRGPPAISGLPPIYVSRPCLRSPGDMSLKGAAARRASLAGRRPPSISSPATPAPRVSARPRRPRQRPQRSRRCDHPVPTRRGLPPSAFIRSPDSQTCRRCPPFPRLASRSILWSRFPSPIQTSSPQTSPSRARRPTQTRTMSCSCP